MKVPLPVLIAVLLTAQSNGIEATNQLTGKFIRNVKLPYHKLHILMHFQMSALTH